STSIRISGARWDSYQHALAMLCYSLVNRPQHRGQSEPGLGQLRLRLFRSPIVIVAWHLGSPGTTHLRRFAGHLFKVDRRQATMCMFSERHDLVGPGLSPRADIAGHLPACWVLIDDPTGEALRRGVLQFGEPNDALDRLVVPIVM